MKLLLDTDIGTDVDDALALGVLLGSPEVDMVGITTVYGHTRLRAQLASRLVGLARPELNIPIVAGERGTRSGRPVWWPGHEGKLYNDLRNEPIAAGADGVNFLVDTARRLNGELCVLAIGPLTNIAAALDADPKFADNVRRLVIMGGDFRTGDQIAEHNFLSDVAAAQRVFDSDLDIVVGGLDLTTQIEIRQHDVDRIAQSGLFGAALSNEIFQWWKFHGHAWNHPHDPILALWTLEPALFDATRAIVHIQDDGFSVDEPDEDGNVLVLRGLRKDKVATHMVDRICAASSVPLLVNLAPDPA